MSELWFLRPSQHYFNQVGMFPVNYDACNTSSKANSTLSTETQGSNLVRGSQWAGLPRWRWGEGGDCCIL